MKELFENISSSMGVAAKLITGVGIAVLFSYCFFDINFFPTGLSLGDSLVFIFSAMGFGIFYFFWLSLGIFGVYFCVYPFHPMLGKKEGSTKWVTFSVGAAFVIALAGIAVLFGDVKFIVAPLFSGAIFLFATSLWKTKSEGSTEAEIREHDKSRVVFFLMVLLLPILLAAIPIKLFVSASIQNLGFRKNNVSLILSKENYAHIENIATELNIPLFGCSLEANKDSKIVHNVNVLWHGLGEKSLVEIAFPTSQGQNTVVRVELDSKGVKILQIGIPSSEMHGTIKSCISLNTDTLFDTYSSIPNQIGVDRLDELKKKIATYTKGAKLKTNSVSIAGYTDQAPVLLRGDSNIALSKRRADAVAAALADLFSNLSKDDIHVSGNGSTTPKSNCSEHLSRMELDECRAVDRRVEIVFVFSKRPLDTGN